MLFHYYYEIILVWLCCFPCFCLIWVVTQLTLISILLPCISPFLWQISYSWQNLQLSRFSMWLWGSCLIHLSFHLLLFHCRQDCDSALFITESQRRMCQEWASEYICTYTMWMLWRFYEPWLFRLIYFSDARHTSKMQFIDWLLKHALVQIKVSAWQRLSHNLSSLPVERYYFHGDVFGMHWVFKQLP